MSKDFGDFQTPAPLVDEIITCLSRKNKRWARVLEPTCGQGNFIKGLLQLDTPPQEIQGIEIQNKYIAKVQKILQQQNFTRGTIKEANIFEIDLQSDLKWEKDGSLLVVGNPPWVTNAELSILESSNLPAKTNFKGFSGFGAMTGESNFDIAEYIWLKLIRELAEENPTIALLCKTSVARNILKFSFDTNIPIADACMWKINSKEYFGTSVDACLFVIDLRPGNHCYQAKLYQNLRSTDPYTTIGIVHGQLVSNIAANQRFASIKGTSPLTWRQGLKHDAAAVFELIYNNSGELCNKLGEIVKVEQEYVFPLLKSSDLGGKTKARSRKAVLVTQKHIGANTLHLKDNAPLLWNYLSSHQAHLDARKSSIYKNQPPFAIFGIGDYSFAPYKVAISGMYKQLKFSAIGPLHGCPVQFDDTCYFIACSTAKQAAIITCLLNHPICHDFLQSIVFWDAKRPITKKLLQCVDLRAVLKQADRQLLLEQAILLLEELMASPEVPHEWPEHLEDFLVDYALNPAPINSAFSEESVGITQMGLFQGVPRLLR